MMNPTEFFLNDTATTEIYTLSLHDALPISRQSGLLNFRLADLVKDRVLLDEARACADQLIENDPDLDRKSTRLNSSHDNISYAVFCLTKKDYTLINFHI